MTRTIWGDRQAEDRRWGSSRQSEHIKIIGYSIAVSLALAVAPAHASVINFDDVNTSFGDVSLDAISPYDGYTWTNVLAYLGGFGYPGFTNGVVSASNAAYSGGQGFNGVGVVNIVGEIQSSNPFDFTSAYLGSAYYDNLSLTLEGLRNGSPIYSTTLTLDTTGAQLFNFNFDNIDTLTFTAGTTASTTDPYFCGTFDCNVFTMDNLTLTAAGNQSNNAMPEPPTLALFGIAAIAASIVRRKQIARST